MKRKFSCISVSALLVTGILSASIVAPAYAKAGGQGQGQTSGGQGQTSSGQGQTSGGQTSSAICSICTLKNYLSVLKN
ncbi:hypothetical protein [Trichormus variabilis]|uniref:hypothetical protein n=1 Tax=Anabaena variabilis TaxID=264691 RepID=UPI001CD033BE|nr:hypothetical protein [Trichormus variabilis]